MHAMARRAIQASLLEDVRGSAIEKVVVVAFFVLVGAAGVRHLGSVTEKTLTCQGQAIQRADGTVACVGSAVGQGVPETVVCRITGHSKLSVTARYTHPSAEAMRRAADALPQICHTDLRKFGVP